MSEDTTDRATTSPPPLIPPPVRRPENAGQAAVPADQRHAPEMDGPNRPEFVEPVSTSTGDRAAVPLGADRPVTNEPPAVEEPAVAAVPANGSTRFAPGGDQSPRDESVRAEPVRDVPVRVDPPTAPADTLPGNARPVSTATDAEPAHTEATPVEAATSEPRRDAPTTAEAVPVAHPSTAPDVPPSPIFVPAAETSRQRSADATESRPQRTFTQAPVEPKKKGNRAVGSLIAVLSVVFFAILYLLVAAVIIGSRQPQALGQIFLEFVVSPVFYVPSIIYVIGFVIVVLLANRANWWAYVLGSLLVGALVYFGTIGVALITENVLGMTAVEARDRFADYAVNPFIIAAALIAREVSLWTGALISSRGRRMKARNAAARKDFERATAEHRAEYERGYTAAG
ncbi:MAG: hypothetical protein JWL94_636 [Microbacteriaceae bacterium]|nr:hypothetical protein [Microbacteriaceae bacterium]HEV7957606.1 hypothetical protein [Marisediminicola sp.]